MTTELAERRKATVLRLFIVAGIMAATAAVTITIEARSARPDLAAGLAAPGFAEHIADAQKITIVSKDESFRIERIERGEERAWVMRDRADYPVRADRLAALSENLTQLALARRMTSDPSKHARLGVGDPREGGEGVLVQIEDERGAFLVNLIFGIDSGALYVRRPDEDQTWSARGEAPPLRAIAAWLDLAPQVFLPQDVARVEVTPAEGRAYILARDKAEDRDFRIAAPEGVVPESPARVTETALRITRIAPVDVQPAPAINAPARARLRVRAYVGVYVDAEIVDSDGKSWLKMVARADTPAEEPLALDLNERIAPWAFGLTAEDAQSLAGPLANLLPQAPAEGEPPDL